MKELARLLNDMRAEGVIADYALFGAAAQMRYTEPSQHLTLTCSSRFLPASGSMCSAPFTSSVRGRDIGRKARPKDLTRILALLESGSVSREEIASLARQHGLEDAWKRFVARFLDG